MNDSDRITELEISLAHVQRLFDQLNTVVTEQAMRADRMQRKMALMEEQIKSVKEKSTEQPPLPEDEKPPHY